MAKQSSKNALAALDGRILAAHARDDLTALAALYGQAAELLLQDGQIGAACFYYTHAYVFALDAGDKNAAHFKAKLVSFGREA